MLTYDLNNRGKMPMYEYLYQCIKKDIVTGKLKANEKLPSKRQLAENLGISLITIQNAYEQLLVEGYLYTLERRGYFVSEIDIKDLTETKKVATGTEQEKNNDIRVDFTSGHILYDHFPYSSWAKLMRKTLLDEQGAFLESPHHQGVYDLRKAISEHLREFRGLEVNPEHIVIGAGTEYLYSMIVQLVGRSGMIAVEDPGHLKVTQVYESCGIKVLHIPVDHHGMSIDALKNAHVTAIHISPSHQFPTGIVMSASRRHGLIRLAREMECVIIEDDYDSEFRFVGKPISTLKSLDDDNVIYMNTFSRTLSPSIRISYMVLPEKLMERYQKKMSFYSCTVSGMEQYTLASFISEGYYGRHINRMRNYYRTHRNEILETIRTSHLFRFVSIEEENAGLHFILRINQEIDDEQYALRLLQQGIKINPVSHYCFRPQKNYEHCFIINYASVDVPKMKEVLEIMYEELKKTE